MATPTEIELKVAKVFNDNDLNYDYGVNPKGEVNVEVHWGDWKHDHIALQNAMKKAGYLSFGRHIIEDDEDNGDDSFSAIYL